MADGRGMNAGVTRRAPSPGGAGRRTVREAGSGLAETPGEFYGGRIATRLNWLRAGVMGANDGIVSTGSLVVGVAGAAVSNGALAASGLAAVTAGALSMGVGEYVSVSSQRDSQKAELAHERMRLDAEPERELDELASLIRAQGVDAGLALELAGQLTDRDALAAHARYELGIHPHELTNAWHAAWASMLAFVLGALVPLAAILLSERDVAVPVTGVAVVVALAITGCVSAHLGGAPKLRAVLRTVGGGLGAMVVTYSLGLVVGARI